MNYTLITGACGGLGRSFVKLSAENKENLALVGTNEMKLKTLIDDFKEEFEGLNVKTFVCDISSKSNRQKLIDDLKKEEVVVNKLINNAGLIIEGDMLKFSDEEISKAVEINCIGTLDLTKKIIEIRDESQKLEVLTVSSQSAFQPIPHMAVYGATKSFLVSMMTALAVELKEKNIIITTTCPSGMATTQAMKDSIKSMGFKGKITTLSTDKVARISLKALKKKKVVVIPGFVNKFVGFLSKFCSIHFLAKTTGKMWKKSQKKRGL